MKAARLVAILLMLQAREVVTAAEIAEELEISVATARRDLYSLSAAGVPVYAQRGRGGGWALLGGGRTDLSGLSFPEVQALFMLMGPAAAVSADARSGLRKLVRALPETFRAPAEAASSAVVVDAARWGDEPEEPDDLLDTMRTAVVRRDALLIAYGDDERREVDPWGLIDKDGTWYVIAGTTDGTRTFRVDRIRSAVPAGRAFQPPAGLDLAATWSEISARLEDGRSVVSAQVTLPEALVHPFIAVLGARHVEHTGTSGDREELRVTSNTVDMLARQLAGWAPEIDVLAPPEVRAALAAIGADLSARYGVADFSRTAEGRPVGEAERRPITPA